LTGQDLETVAADFEDPAAKLAQLSHLEDAALHRRLGDRLAPLLSEFEQGPIHAMYSEVVPTLRAADPTGLILREPDYFGNIGIPAPMPPLADTAWAYSPQDTTSWWTPRRCRWPATPASPRSSSAPRRPPSGSGCR